MDRDAGMDRIRLQMATLSELGVVGPDGLTVERIARRAELPEEAVTDLYPDVGSLLYQSVEHAIEDIGRLERHPIYTLHVEPRQEYAGRLFLLAATCTAVLLLAARSQRLAWGSR